MDRDDPGLKGKGNEDFASLCMYEEGSMGSKKGEGVAFGCLPLFEEKGEKRRTGKKATVPARGRVRLLKGTNNSKEI